MLSSIGSGNENFTFSFAHHGQLPGMATFAVSTDLAEGTQVNVYKFEAAANEFTLIADKLNVGEKGVVTYKNNTMSEYLVTTQTLSNATVSVVATQQGSSQGNNWWLAGLGLLVVVLGAGFWFLLLKRKKVSKPEM